VDRGRHQPLSEENGLYVFAMSKSTYSLSLLQILQGAALTDEEQHVQQFLEALKSSTRPAGRKFVWGSDPADDPGVIKFRELQAEAAAFRQWDQDNPATFAGVNLKESVGQELNRAIARAPNIAGPKQDQLFAGAFAVLDINDPAEYEAFRKKHWLYSNRTKLLTGVTDEAAAERQQILVDTANRIHVGDAVPDIVKLLPGITGLLTGSPVFPKADEVGENGVCLSEIQAKLLQKIGVSSATTLQLLRKAGPSTGSGPALSEVEWAGIPGALTPHGSGRAK